MTSINEKGKAPNLPAAEEKQEPITIETAKVIQGISLVFCGALTMLEALHPHVSLAPSAILDLVTGNTEGLAALAAKKRAAVEEKENHDAETTDDGTVDAVPAADADASVDSNPAAEVMAGGAETAAEEKQEAITPTVTADDITKIIVQKIKQNRSNNEKIGAILKTYGVSKVSELPASRYEAFVTDLSAI